MTDYQYPDHVTVVDTHGHCSRTHETDVKCAGPTRERLSRSGLTAAVICAAHEDALNARLDQIDRRYPDSPNPPAWFDAGYAGESWDGE